MFKFIVNGIMIQMITLGIQYFLYNEDDEIPYNEAGGIWFCYLTKYCLFNGDE